MSNTLESNTIIPTTAHYIHQGEGPPVIMIHGVAASLHDWDDLLSRTNDNALIVQFLRYALPASMLMAVPAMTAMTMSEITDWAIISILAVRDSGAVSVGLKATLVI